MPTKPKRVSGKVQLQKLLVQTEKIKLSKSAKAELIEATGLDTVTRISASKWKQDLISEVEQALADYIYQKNIEGSLSRPSSIRAQYGRLQKHSSDLLKELNDLSIDIYPVLQLKVPLDQSVAYVNSKSRKPIRFSRQESDVSLQGQLRKLIDACKENNLGNNNRQSRGRLRINAKESLDKKLADIFEQYQQWNGSSDSDRNSNRKDFSKIVNEILKNFK